jgi:hypothetical protein
MGQARLVKSLSATMCSKIEEEEKKRPLNALTPEEGKSLFIQIVTATMSEHTDQLSSLMTTNKISKGKAHALGEVLGREATMRLMKTCPASQPLVMQLGLSEIKNKPTITPEEKPVLTVLVDDICKRIDAEQAKASFSQLTPSARLELMQQCMQGAVLKHLEELSIFYGLKTIQSASEMEKIGVKIAFVMAEQCPGHLTKMGLDSNDSKGKK